VKRSKTKNRDYLQNEKNSLVTASATSIDVRLCKTV